MWFFYCLNSERNYDVLKSKTPSFLLNKNINFNKNGSESKLENPIQSFRETILSFSSYKVCELEVRLRWVVTRERRKRAFFVSLILPEGIFFSICVLFQCLVNWINFHNICTFTYQKKLVLMPFYLFLKSSKAFSVSLFKKICRKVAAKVTWPFDQVFLQNHWQTEITISLPPQFTWPTKSTGRRLNFRGSYL